MCPSELRMPIRVCRVDVGGGACEHPMVGKMPRMGRENLSLKEETVFRPVPWLYALTLLLPYNGRQPIEPLCSVVSGLWETAEAWGLLTGGRVILPCLTLSLFSV